MRSWRGTIGRLLVVIVLAGMIAGVVPSLVQPGIAAAQPTPPSISLSQDRGLLGRSITITASGFGGSEPVDIRWRSTSNVPAASATTSSSGAFTLAFALPDAPNGPQSIYATGRASGRQASAVYTVERPAPQSGRIAEGAYSIYATRIGLIGNTTSSGHVIREGDYFVAMPACTPTNCPGGPYWGAMTNCGSRCFVKVVNPQTNACRVEPILDVGPWFRVDDWWNPTDQRYLNGLTSNPADLPQGYTGSSAARDGYNVGYGIGPGGIGNDDTGSQGNRPVRQVGNRAAIDLADGTWRALNLASDGTGAQIRVELLWQTGADPGAAANGCGHPLNQTPATESPGVSNPSFAGSALVPVSTSQSANGSGAAAAVDGNLQTSWTTTNANPTTGQFTIDHGQVRSLTGIRWNFSQFGFADHMVVETSTNGTSWSAVGVFGNAEPGQWRGVALARQGRYVRVSFSNPNGDIRLGQIAEVQAWGQASSSTTPTPTPAPIAGSDPQLTGSQLRIVASSQSSNSSAASRAYDRDLGSSWSTTSADIPETATVTFDLGQVQQLSGVRWIYRLSGGADRMRLQVSSDGATWAQLVTTSNRLPLTWEGWRTTARARYIRFVFDNPNRVAVLGYLAEVEVWGTPSASSTPSPTPPPTANPTPTSTSSPSPSPTATATASPTVPASPAGAFGVVTNTGGARLNCRATASTNGAIIVALAEGSRVQLRGPASNGWYPVVCANRNGWVSSTYLRVDSGTPTPGTTPTPTPTPVTTGIIANAGGDRVNCRAAPSTAGAIITSLAEGTQVQLRGPAVGGWQPVRCANQDGYVFAQYIAIRLVAPTPSPTVPPPTVTSTPAGPAYGFITNSGGSRVNCRLQPSTAGTIVTSLPEGTRVELRGGAQGGWQPVRCVNRDGWIASQYMSVGSRLIARTPDPAIPPASSTTTLAPPSPTPMPSPTATVFPTVTATMVSTPTPGITGVGYIANTGGNRINCRIEPSTESGVLTVLSEGASIDLRGAPTNGWQGVRCAGSDGFVAEQFIALEPPAPTSTPPPVTVPPEIAPTEEVLPEGTEPPPPVVAMPGSNPQFGGAQLDITDVWGTNGGNNAWRSIDGSQETSWVSASGVGQASLTINLGSPRSLTGIRWMYLQAGGADSMRLQVSLDGSEWTQLVTTSNRAPYTWEGWYTDATAQFVRLVFDNPNGAPELGYVAEVQVWGTGSASGSPTLARTMNVILAHSGPAAITRRRSARKRAGATVPRDWDPSARRVSHPGIARYTAATNLDGRSM